MGCWASNIGQQTPTEAFLETCYNMGNIPVTTTTKIFQKRTAIQMGGVLQYKWEAYCDTNGGSTDSIPFPQSIGAPQALQYKLEAYCDTDQRCIAILFLRSSGGWGFLTFF